MIIVMEKNSERSALEAHLNEKGYEVHTLEGGDDVLLHVVGDTNALEAQAISSHEGVKKVIRTKEPYRYVNKPRESGPFLIGEQSLDTMLPFYIAGPCSVESEDQIMEIAKKVKEAGAHALRGGAFKPRSSPHSFQGLEKEGLMHLKNAARAHGLFAVSEIMDKEDLPLFEESVDIIQVGARNMQNYTLLKALGKSRKPVLLKRGFANTVEEWLLSAEYLMMHGNDRIILCERGIRTFEPSSRHTLDLGGMLTAKQTTHLPVIVDPSHAAGDYRLVEGLSRASIAAGADGLMIEVHANPFQALSDGAQSLKPKRFAKLLRSLHAFDKHNKHFP